MRQAIEIVLVADWQFSGCGNHDMRSAWQAGRISKRAWRNVGRKTAQDLARYILRDAAEVKQQSKGVAATSPLENLESSSNRPVFRVDSELDQAAERG
ncbi:hypothetical protein [Sphingomonas sp. G-3-2-10]|uniref:hypothetical protein n=1 Tax=Sphingomonas sp. G-3-2-10 TaxID=2728838 RepID=UPI00146BC257|nr:hypothetical protein [Sphingomonas sp. G-3-2-10]NML04910.1 hypothetical protein [Sphingomonas sp. G-3-2-10]